MMETFTDRMLADSPVAKYLASLLERRQYADVVAYYEAQPGHDDHAGDAAAVILFIVAKAYASLTRQTQALKTARLAQNAAARAGDTPLLAEIFVSIGSILRGMGELNEAENAFRDAESIFRRTDHTEGRSRVLNLLAGLYFKQQDYRPALRVLLDAIELARKLGDQRKLAFMMGNIGRIQTFLGEFADARKHLTLNADLSADFGDTLEEARARLSLGYLDMICGRYDEAEQSLAAAQRLLLVCDSKADTVIYLTYLGELQYRRGQMALSRNSLETALTLARQVGPETTLTGRVLRHRAELDLREKHFRNAHRLASTAWVIMERAGEQVELAALMRIRAQLAEADGDFERARTLFESSISGLSHVGVRFEKAETLMAAGAGQSFDNRRRLSHLFRAQQFYASAGADPMREQCDRLLEQIDMEPGVYQRPAPVATGAVVDYVTACASIERIKSQLQSIGRSDLPVLLTGETGVGKDHMARYYHGVSRPGKPYVAINCASVPETLLESELFGFARGAFTGADQDKNGLFVAAHGGVLLLDEIGDMPLTLQSKLLGVLEQRKVVPLGSTRPIEIDFRLVAATNKNLEAMVEAGSFRRDLYYRLSGVTFEIPPLRERREDIPLLLSLFLRSFGLLGQTEEPPVELVGQFVAYNWPGNIRELRNRVKRLEIMAGMVAEGDLVELSRSLFYADAEQPVPRTLFDRVEQFERQLILEALVSAKGNKSEAARILGIHEATVRTKLKRYGINMEAVN